MALSKVDFLMGQYGWTSELQNNFIKSIPYQILKTLPNGLGADIKSWIDRQPWPSTILDKDF
jgi:hypothetical protein